MAVAQLTYTRLNLQYSIRDGSWDLYLLAEIFAVNGCQRRRRYHFLQWGSHWSVAQAPVIHYVPRSKPNQTHLITETYTYMKMREGGWQGKYWKSACDFQKSKNTGIIYQLLQLCGSNVERCASTEFSKWMTYLLLLLQICPLLYMQRFGDYILIHLWCFLYGSGESLG